MSAVAAAQAEGKRVSWAATTAGICATDLLVVAVYDDKRVGLRSPREESIFTGSCRELASGSTSVQLEGEKPRPFVPGVHPFDLRTIIQSRLFVTLLLQPKFLSLAIFRLYLRSTLECRLAWDRPTLAEQPIHY